jgi:carboxypeptidase family protein
MCSILAKSLLLGLVLSAACSEALACSCMILSAHDHYGNAAAAFVGTAIEKTDSAGHVRFHIEESFWGTTGDSIVVKQYDPIVCDSFAFTIGEKYLIIAYKQNDELTVGPCNQGAGMEYAAGDLHALRAQSRGKPLPYVYGIVTKSDGTPLSNARVVLRNQAHRSKIVAETRTEIDGYFEFASVSSGGYLVIATPAGGGTSIKDSFGTDFPGRPVPGVRLIMHESLED